MLRTMALFCGERTTHVFVPGCSLLFRRKADVHLDVIDFCISLSFYRLPEDHDFPAIHAGVPSLLLGLGGKERNMTIGYKIFRVPIWQELFGSIKVRLVRVLKNHNNRSRELKESARLLMLLHLFNWFINFNLLTELLQGTNKLCLCFQPNNNL
jgi:hypothetical protein